MPRSTALIGRLGFLPIARKQRWNIPKKLDFISQSGLLAPRILRKITGLRNRLEHEFAPPSKHQVEDALDVAMLFVSYADLVRVPSMNWTLASKLTVRYDYDRMIFHFYATEPSDANTETNPPLLSVAHGEPGFQDFHDFIIQVHPLDGTKLSLAAANGRSRSKGARPLSFLSPDKPHRSSVGETRRLGAVTSQTTGNRRQTL
jgi:hypothetical protein